MDGHRQQTGGILTDYCDGKQCQANALFSADQAALQLILYYDELELCNPLGSHRKKHKIGIHVNQMCLATTYSEVITIFSGAFYFLLGNLSPCFRSKVNSIQLLCLAKYTTIAEFGIDEILKPILEDIKKLESVRL